MLYAKLSQIPGLEVRAHEPMAHHTTFRVGGPAALMALPKRLEELSAVLRAAAEAGIVPFFLARGPICWWPTRAWTAFSSSWPGA